MNRKFIRYRWSQFDLAILVFHYLSIALHIYQLAALHLPSLGLVYEPSYAVVRSARPFIMIRLVRLSIHFKLPQNRIENIIK